MTTDSTFRRRSLSPVQRDFCFLLDFVPRGVFYVLPLPYVHISVRTLCSVVKAATTSSLADTISHNDCNFLTSIQALNTNKVTTEQLRLSLLPQVVVKRLQLLLLKQHVRESDFFLSISLHSIEFQQSCVFCFPVTFHVGSLVVSPFCYQH